MVRSLPMFDQMVSAEFGAAVETLAILIAWTLDFWVRYTVRTEVTG